MEFEIKFRAWDGDKKEMHLPEYTDRENFHVQADGQIVYTKEYGYERHELTKPRPKWKLMQFTGHKDKNDKEIYVGDIVKHEIILKSDFGHPDKDISNFYEVVFDKNILDIVGFYWKCKTRLLHGSPKNFEIVGNIYETPELLIAGGQEKINS